MNILIADDHALVRAGLAMMLARFYPESAIREAEDLDSAIAGIEEALPDILLLDLAMPGMEQFNGLSRLLETWPALKIVMLSAHAGREEVRAAMERGARGYIPKAAGVDLVRHALELVMAGEMFVPASAFRDAPATAREEDADSPLESLTPRQKETLALVMQGRSNKEIARALGVIESTVKTHLKVIMRKLGARNRTDAARIATQFGMTTAFLAEPLQKLQ